MSKFEHITISNETRLTPEQIENILKVAEDSFREGPGLSMLPGVYAEDNTPAPPDITSVIIEELKHYPDYWKVITPAIPDHGSWVAYVLYELGMYQEFMGATTIEGYCKPGCSCDRCQHIRHEAVEKAATIAFIGED